MIATLTLVTSLVLGPNPVWRSVGSHPNALETGVGAATPFRLSISGHTATFSRPVSDHIGLGDVIQYDTDGDGTVDQLAFITFRNSSTSFDLADRTTGDPAAVADTGTWSIFRAYLTLAAAVNTASRQGLELGGTENPAIDAALRDFDTFVGGKDLPGPGHRWMVACYDDGPPDDRLVQIGPPWITDALHRMEIFTPVNADEVGVSQRHDGTWGTGYRRTQALHIIDRDVWVDGLSIRQARALGGVADPNLDNRVLIVHTGHKGSEIHISNCYGEQADSLPSAWARTFDFFDDDTPYGALQTVVRVWNTIGVTQSTGQANGSGAFFANTSDELFLSNCTGVAPNGAAAFSSGNVLGSAKSATVVNGLGFSAGGQAVVTDAGLPFVMSFTAVSDNSIGPTTSSTPDAGNALGQTFAFVGATDYHLAATDTGARGRGVDLSSDPVNRFNTDINGYPRSVPWDVGAAQYFDPLPPNADTGQVTMLTADSAKLTGTSNGNASPTVAWFRYSSGPVTGCDDAFGTRAPASGALAVGSSGNVRLEQVVTGLTPGATYAYCALASNRAGLTFGSVLTFVAEFLPDAGAPDAGELDAGRVDAGELDAGAGLDGGSGGGSDTSGQTLGVACGCGDPGGLAVLGALALLLLRRRGQRTAEFTLRR